MAVTAFDLLISLGVDSSAVNSGLNAAGKSVSGFAATMSGVMSTVGKGALIAVEHGVMALADGIQTATQAAVSLTNQAVSAYGEYEQLVGGTKLLFGEASDFILAKSSKAFKTVQMSQAEYLRQVNGFSTGLKNALGGDSIAAAKLADRIINAEADVVAATGQSAEMVQNAFNGLMRNNYTMLDNLQLGIKPTKEGMEELIKTVNAWNAENNRATDYQLDNLADLQSAVLDYIEMQGISTYAAKEGATTVQGSMAALKSVWNDIISNLGNEEADMNGMVKNLVDTAIATLDGNLLPTVEKVLNGISSLVASIVPKAIREFPSLLEEHIPLFIAGVGNIINAVLDALPKAITGVRGAMVGLVNTVLESVDGIIDDILAKLPFIVNQFSSFLAVATNLFVDTIKDFPSVFARIVDGILPLIETLSDAFADSAPKILDGILSVFTSSQVLGSLQKIMKSMAGTFKQNAGIILDAIQTIGETVVNVLVKDVLPFARENIIPAVMDVIKNIAEHLPAYVSILTTLVSGIVDAVTGIVKDKNNASTFLSLAIQIIQTLAEGAINLLPILLEGAMALIQALAEAVTANLEPFMQMVFTIAESLIGFIFENLPTLIQTMIDVVLMLVEAIDANIDKFAPVAVEMIITLINGLIKMTPVLFDAILDILFGLQKIMIEHLPMFLQMGLELIGVLVKGFIDGATIWLSSIVACVMSIVQHIADTIFGINWIEVGVNIVSSIAQGLLNGASKVIEAAMSIGNNISSTIGNIFGVKTQTSAVNTEAITKSVTAGVSANLANMDFGLSAPAYAGGISFSPTVYIGDRQVDAMVKDSNKRNTYRSGGR